MPGYEVGIDKLQCNPKIYSPKVAVESCLSTWTCPNLASRRRNEERKSSFVRKTKTTKPIRIEFLAGDIVEIPLVFPLFFCCLFHRRVCDHIAGGSGLGWWLRSLNPFPDQFALQWLLAGIAVTAQCGTSFFTPPHHHHASVWPRTLLLSCFKPIPSRAG